LHVQVTVSVVLLAAQVTLATPFGQVLHGVHVTPSPK